MSKPKLINKELTHCYIINDLVVRTLELDLDRTGPLKTKILLDKIYGKALDLAKLQLKEATLQMKREGLRILDIKKEEDLFTLYTVTQFGLTEDIRYMSYALRNHTMTEIENLIRIQ